MHGADGCDEGDHKECIERGMRNSPEGTFYCWECVSLVMEKRTIDFVIKDHN